MGNIVFIDDEHGPIDYYVRALEEIGHKVEHLDSVEQVFAHLEAGKTPDIFIVDIMMPTHGRPELEGAADGLATGIVFHREIRKRFPSVPIIILTSIANPDILAGLHLEPDTQIESKIDTLPFELSEIVDSIIRGRSADSSLDQFRVER